MNCRYSLILSIALTAAVAAADDGLPPQESPYEASLIANDVYVRSGPGTEFYPTQKLQSGDTVEVYRHDPGGWCAIRPPRESFTWVASRFVKPMKDRLGEIVGSRVAARVGSSFSAIRDVVQVRLQKGEVVEILEVSPDGQWTKIAPPSGEFRWIHRKFLQTAGGDSGLRRPSSASSPVVGNPFDRAVDQGRDLGPNPSYARDASRLDSPVSTLGPPESDFPSSQVPRVLSPEEFATELDNLNIDLSTMVAEEPTVWEFGDLASRAQGLLMQAETAVERGRARILLTKVRRFEDIRDRYRKLNALALHADTRNRRYETASRPDARPMRVANSSRFDGSGRLTRIHSPKPGAPRFALVDEQGGVQCYVTPAPGVNLQYYLGKEIGVNGMRGYVPEQRAPHVTAKHVEALNGGLLR